MTVYSTTTKSAPFPKSAIDNQLAALTSRQIECLRLVFEGFEVKDIAQKLSISPRVVDEHLAKARAKLGVPRSKTAARIVAASLSWASVGLRGDAKDVGDLSGMAAKWPTDRKPAAILEVRDPAVSPSSGFSAGANEGDVQPGLPPLAHRIAKLLLITTIVVVGVLAATRLPEVFAQLASIVRPPK